MDTQVLDVVHSCHMCQLNDKTVKSHPAPLLPVALPDGPWQKVVVNIVGPLDIAASDFRFAMTIDGFYYRYTLLTLSLRILWFYFCHQLSAASAIH